MERIKQMALINLEIATGTNMVKRVHTSRGDVENFMNSAQFAVFHVCQVITL